MAQRAVSHRVVRRTPPLRLIFIVVIVLALLGWLCSFVFDLGRKRAGFDSEASQREVHLLELRVQDYQDENRRLREKVALLESGNVIDRKAYSRLERNLEDLQNEVRELELEVSFYQELVAPTGLASGIQVEHIEITPLAPEREYRLKIVLVQGAKAGRAVSGRVYMILHGIDEGVQKELTLKQLTGGKVSSFKYGFKYFQNFQTDITLPDGFKPTRVLVRADSADKNKGKVEKMFQWSHHLKVDES
jgi:hypothetical protein